TGESLPTPGACYAVLRRLPRRDWTPPARCSRNRPSTTGRFDQDVPSTALYRMTVHTAASRTAGGFFMR
ncbi:MAG TPA: hypothetical protein VK797_20820, partial [Tepidisphaeraceae bacterium]|nr:hypothetical protein [Tepidisphaeraceae bacterium]